MSKKGKTYHWSEVSIHLKGKQIKINCINYDSHFYRLSNENLKAELEKAEEIEDYETCQIIKNIIDEKMEKNELSDF